MTEAPEQPSRLDRIEALAIRNTEAIANITAKIDNLTDNVQELTSNVDRVLARSAILDDVLVELRESHETHQRNFEEHQRTTNAALNQLGAILVQLTRIDPQN
ncbi:hypothetical protein LC612_31010 [Nostoc sp. CHAB 5834]|nr:hypothetical protein [Nostoc sp. CHAB 5834]